MSPPAYPQSNYWSEKRTSAGRKREIDRERERERERQREKKEENQINLATRQLPAALHRKYGKMLAHSKFYRCVAAFQAFVGSAISSLRAHAISSHAARKQRSITFRIHMQIVPHTPCDRADRCYLELTVPLTVRLINFTPRTEGQPPPLAGRVRSMQKACRSTAISQSTNHRNHNDTINCTARPPAYQETVGNKMVQKWYPDFLTYP